jgi:radical SAM superfamily enzyme YgiQ (UPF0313 family)
MLTQAGEAGAAQQLLGCFPSEVRPDRVSEKLLAVVREHCFNRTIVVGAQSGSDRVLRLMGRGHGVDAAKRAVALIAGAGMRPHVDILLCFPGESGDEQQQSLDLADWCIKIARARVHAHVYLPLPASPAWPTPPEKLERQSAQRLRSLTQSGALDGFWQQHIGMGRQIARWREQGLILV